MNMYHSKSSGLTLIETLIAIVVVVGLLVAALVLINSSKTPPPKLAVIADGSYTKLPPHPLKSDAVVTYKVMKADVPLNKSGSGVVTGMVPIWRVVQGATLNFKLANRDATIGGAITKTVTTGPDGRASITLTPEVSSGNDTLFLHVSVDLNGDGVLTEGDEQAISFEVQKQ